MCGLWYAKVAVESGAVDESLTPEQIVKRLIEWS